MNEELNDAMNIDLNDSKMNVIDPLDILVNHTFSENDEDINLDESLEMMDIIDKEEKIAKQMEAQTVIDTLSDKYIDETYKKELDGLFSNMKNFLEKYNVEKDEMKNKNDIELTKLFRVGKFLMGNITAKLEKVLMNINFSTDELKLLINILDNKLEYDGTEVFNLIELNDNYIKPWKEQYKNIPKGVNKIMLSIDIANIIMLYHFIVKYKIKGITKEYYDFVNILKNIANTNKLYNAYATLKERLNNDFIFWTGATEELNKQSKDEIIVNK